MSHLHPWKWVMMSSMKVESGTRCAAKGCKAQPKAGSACATNNTSWCACLPPKVSQYISTGTAVKSQDQYSSLPYRTVILRGLLDLVLVVIDSRDVGTREKGDLTQGAPNTAAHVQDLGCRQQVKYTLCLPGSDCSWSCFGQCTAQSPG